MGFFPHYPHARGGAGARLALPRFVHGRRLRRRVHFLGFIERPIYWALGTSPSQEQTWKRYAGAMIIFSSVSIAFTYILSAYSGFAPSQSQTLPGVARRSASTRRRRSSPTPNWQNYGGEETMSYFSQIGALTVQQFVSPAVGIAVAIVLVRGFARRSMATIATSGLTSRAACSTSSCPLRSSRASFSWAKGQCRRFRHDQFPRRVERRHPDDSARARLASWSRSSSSVLTVVASSTRTRPRHLRPDGTDELALHLLTLVHSLRLDLHLWKDVGSVRHGAALLAAMVLLFGVWVGFTANAEHQNNPAIVGGRHSFDRRQHGGKEVRFGDTSTALFGVASTSTSTGSADASMTPSLQWAPRLLTGMMIGEVTPGGTGSGLYTLLIYAIIAVFIGGADDW